MRQVKYYLPSRNGIQSVYREQCMNVFLRSQLRKECKTETQDFTFPWTECVIWTSIFRRMLMLTFYLPHRASFLCSAAAQYTESMCLSCSLNITKEVISDVHVYYIQFHPKNKIILLIAYWIERFWCLLYLDKPDHHVSVGNFKVNCKRLKALECSRVRGK